jgi:hypothetical protein
VKSYYCRAQLIAGSALCKQHVRGGAMGRNAAQALKHGASQALHLLELFLL